MNADEDFLNFLQLHPELYEVSRSEAYMNLIKTFNQARSMNDLLSMFPSFDSSDLEAMVFSLFKLNVLAKAATGEKVYYYLSDLGKLFFEKYAKAKNALGE